MKLGLLILLCFFLLSVNAQDAYIKGHQEFFELPRESIYVHTNKSIFTAEEYLWYKGYAIDRALGGLSNDVRNIQVFVYDSVGSLVDKSMVLANEGIFFNQIKIDSTYRPGRYYFKAMTNYMNNFKESDAYLQKFEVVDEVIETKKKAKDIEVVIRPEGQEIIYGLNTNLGIKITNNLGIPEQSDLTLLEDDKPIREIKSSASGLAKINFRPVKDKAYKIKVTTSGGFKKLIPIDDIKSNGTSLQLSDLKKYIYLNIECTSFKENENWQLIIFQDQKIISVTIEMNANAKSIALEKDKLFNGLNTIQFLRDGETVLERLYLNKTNDKSDFIGDYDVKKIDKQDSIILSLNFENSKRLMLSASVLPKENITYKSQHTIIKTLRLKPYIDRNDFNSFFYDNTLANSNELDVLLFMSKSRYAINLKSLEPPKLQFERKNGFNQSLSLLSKTKKDDELLIGLESRFNKEFIIELDSSRVFNFQNKYPVIGEEQKYSIITKRRKFKAPELSLKTEVIYNDNHPLLLEELDTLSFSNDTKLSKNKVLANYTNTNELDEVVINASRKNEEEKKAPMIQGTKEEITERVAQQYFKLSVYLRARGFRVDENFGSFSVSNFNPRSINAGTQVGIILDGARLSDASILSNITLDQFESVIINKEGFGQGIFGANGIIKLESRRTQLYENESNGLFTLIKVEKGYKSSVPYKNLNYAFFDNEMFRSLGSIGWFPNIVVRKDSQENNSVELKMVDTGLEEAMIYIEGISEDGQLHSYSIPIKLNNIMN
jgi:hypothetical protein